MNTLFKIQKLIGVQTFKSILILFIHNSPNKTDDEKNQIKGQVYTNIKSLWREQHMKPNFEQVFHVEIEFIPSKSFDKVRYIQSVEKIKLNLFKGNCLKNGKNVINRNNENIIEKWNKVKNHFNYELLDTYGLLMLSQYKDITTKIENEYLINMNKLKERTKYELISSFKSLILSIQNILIDKLKYETRYLIFPFNKEINFTKVFPLITKEMQICLNNQINKSFSAFSNKLVQKINECVKKEYNQDDCFDKVKLTITNIENEFLVDVIEKKIIFDEQNESKTTVVPIKLVRSLFQDYEAIAKNKFIELLMRQSKEKIIKLFLLQFKEEIINYDGDDFWIGTNRSLNKIINSEIKNFNQKIEKTKIFSSQEIKQYYKIFKNTIHDNIFEYIVQYITKEHSILSILVQFFITNFCYYQQDKNDWRKWYYYTNESIFDLYEKYYALSLDLLDHLLDIRIVKSSRKYEFLTKNLTSMINKNNIIQKYKQKIIGLYDEVQIIREDNSYTLSYIIYFVILYYLYLQYPIIMNSSFYLILVFCILFFIICQELNFNYYSRYILYSFLDKFSKYFPFLCKSLKRTNKYYTILLNNTLTIYDI